MHIKNKKYIFKNNFFLNMYLFERDGVFTSISGHLKKIIYLPPNYFLVSN